MKVAFPFLLPHDTGLFEEVGFNLGSDERKLRVEVYVNVLPKPRRVVVAKSLCISERN